MDANELVVVAHSVLGLCCLFSLFVSDLKSTKKKLLFAFAATQRYFWGITYFYLREIIEAACTEEQSDSTDCVAVLCCTVRE